MSIRYKQLRREGQNLIVVREIDLDDGTVDVNQLSMPDTVFSIRAGEYGLDPDTEADQVWDIILHEGEVNASEEFHFPLLMTEATLEEARDKHLALCQSAKAGHEKLGRRTPPDKDHRDVLQALQDNSIVDKQLIALYRERMKSNFKRHKTEEAVRATDTATRVQKIKRQMIDELRNREDV